VREDFTEYLDYVVGGTPSRFMRHEADWERLYKFVDYVASIERADRPTEEQVRERVYASLPRREEWAAEIMLAYRHALAVLDRRAASG
jgi:hypothetical protein